MTRDSVFISYWRSDARAQAGRLAAELKRRFGEERVFFDTENIPGGEAFPGTHPGRVGASTRSARRDGCRLGASRRRMGPPAHRGETTPQPGFPADGTWVVRSEGLHPLP